MVERVGDGECDGRAQPTRHRMHQAVLPRVGYRLGPVLLRRSARGLIQSTWCYCSAIQLAHGPRSSLRRRPNRGPPPNLAAALNVPSIQGPGWTECTHLLPDASSRGRCFGRGRGGGGCAALAVVAVGDGDASGRLDRSGHHGGSRQRALCHMDGVCRRSMSKGHGWLVNCGRLEDRCCAHTWSSSDPNWLGLRVCPWLLRVVISSLSAKESEARERM